MNRRNVAALMPGERIENQVFRIQSKDLRTTTQGGLYIHAVLADATGQVPARMWQASEPIFNSIPEGGFLRVKGRTENYKGNLQFIIEALQPVDANQVDLSEFLPHTEGDIDKMWARTVEILRRIEDPNLAALMKEFLADEALVSAFQKAPAAAQLHHAFIGGLLEHTLNVLELALLVIPRYPRLSLDLVLAGVFLHDIGKTAELAYDTNFSYTDEGQLDRPEGGGRGGPHGPAVPGGPPRGAPAYCAGPPRQLRIRQPEAARDSRGGGRPPPRQHRRQGLYVSQGD